MSNVYPKGVVVVVVVNVIEASTQIWVAIEDWYVVLLFFILYYKSTLFYKKRKLFKPFCELFKILIANYQYLKNELLIIFEIMLFV